MIPSRASSQTYLPFSVRLVPSILTTQEFVQLMQASLWSGAESLITPLRRFAKAAKLGPQVLISVGSCCSLIHTCYNLTFQSSFTIRLHLLLFLAFRCLHPSDAAYDKLHSDAG